MVLELIEGGELFDRISEKDHYTERDARLVMKQLASGIAAAHMRNIVHRDLKPENILLISRKDDSTLKIADLGFAKITYNKNAVMQTPCGTPGYVAPEVISGRPYTCACDVWSLGVILYILLVGCVVPLRAYRHHDVIITLDPPSRACMWCERSCPPNPYPPHTLPHS